MTASAPQWPRIGLGWDRHALEAGRPCVLGGLTLPCEVGPTGHSDADVVLHALCDALLGAAGLDDLGTLFPDHDPQWKGAASTVFLEETMRRLGGLGLRPVSVDLVVTCRQPKIGPHRAELRAALAKRLDLPLDRINLKGKTPEGGDAAAENALEVRAVALLLSD